MEIGMGVLEWTPRQFWTSTPHDLFAAIDGWQEKNGNRHTAGLSADAVENLQALIAADQNAQDGQHQP